MLTKTVTTVITEKYYTEKANYVYKYSISRNAIACVLYGRMQAYIEILKEIDEQKASELNEDLNHLPKPI